MKTLLLIFSSFIFLSCTHNAPQSNSVSYTEIAQEAMHSGGVEGIPESNRVITNTADWQSLINQMNMGTDIFTETNIDFNTYEVIAVFDEVQSNGGYTVNITNITETATEISVAYHLSSPNGLATCVLTQAFHIVKIPKSNKPVNFIPY